MAPYQLVSIFIRDTFQPFPNGGQNGSTSDVLDEVWARIGISSNAPQHPCREEIHREMRATMSKSPKKRSGGIMLDITREFLVLLENLRTREKMSRKEFAQEYLVAKNSWLEWSKLADVDLKVEKYLLARICDRFFQKKGLRPEDLRLPKETCRIVRQIFPFQDISFLSTANYSRTFTLTFEWSPSMSHGELVQQILKAVLKVFAEEVPNFSVSKGSLIFSLQLTEGQTDKLLLALQEGVFKPLGLVGYEVSINRPTVDFDLLPPRKKDSNFGSPSIDRYSSLLAHHPEWRLLLTKKQREIIPLLLKRLSQKEIAASLSLSDQDVRSHIRRIYSQLQVKSRTELQDLAFPSDSHR